MQCNAFINGTINRSCETARHVAFKADASPFVYRLRLKIQITPPIIFRTIGTSIICAMGRKVARSRSQVRYLFQMIFFPDDFDSLKTVPISETIDDYLAPILAQLLVLSL